MATYSTDQVTNKQTYHGNVPSNVVQTVVGVFTITTALAADDVVEMLKLPAGSTVVGGYLRATDIDTGTEALDIDIGWAANGTESANPDGFGNLGVWTGDSNNDFELGGELYVSGPQYFTEETTIQLDVNAAANAGGTGTIWLVVEFFV